MANSIFGPASNGGNQVNTSQQNGSSIVDDVRRFVGGNPDGAFNLLMRTNPKFVEFVNNTRGMNAQQILQMYGKG